MRIKARPFAELGTSGRPLPAHRVVAAQEGRRGRSIARAGQADGEPVSVSRLLWHIVSIKRITESLSQMACASENRYQGAALIEPSPRSARRGGPLFACQALAWRLTVPDTC